MATVVTAKLSATLARKEVGVVIGFFLAVSTGYYITRKYIAPPKGEDNTTLKNADVAMRVIMYLSFAIFAFRVFYTKTVARRALDSVMLKADVMEKQGKAMVTQSTSLRSKAGSPIARAIADTRKRGAGKKPMYAYVAAIVIGLVTLESGLVDPKSNKAKGAAVFLVMTGIAVAYGLFVRDSLAVVESKITSQAV
jgi:hypothetical protein